MATFLSPPVRRAVVLRPPRYRYASFAALVLLALAVCLFLGRPAPRSLAHVPGRHGPVGGPSGATTNGWTNLFPLLSAVSAVSSTEAWATGEYGTLLHFTGDQWADVDLPPLHGMYATDIKMLSPIRGWLAAGAHAFHYDGAGWVERSAGLAADGPTVDRLAVVTDSNVWGLGGYSLGNSRYQNLMHWNGSQWQVDSSVHLEIYDLDMAGPRDGWATALGNPSPILLHYDGASWTPTAAPAAAVALRAVVASGPGEVWVTGVDSAAIPRIYQLSNGVWTSWASPDGRQVVDLALAGPDAGWAITDRSILHWDGSAWTVDSTEANLRGLTALADRVWVTGRASFILSRTGNSGWIKQRGGPTSQDLTDVAALSMDDVWAVGYAGTILHYRGGTWEVVPVSFTNDLFAIRMRSPVEGYAVGANIIARWDGVSWTRGVTPNQVLVDLDLVGSDEGWAAGWGGALWHLAAGGWTRVPGPLPVPDNIYLTAIAMDSPTHGWAGGTAPANTTVLWEYTNGAWMDRTAGLPIHAPIILDITLAADGTGWAGGQTGASADYALLHLAGGRWSFDPTIPVRSLAQIKLDSEGIAWVLAGPIYRNRGGAWQTEYLPINYTNDNSSSGSGLALVPQQGAWIAGGRGLLLRYDGTPPPPSATATGTSTPTTTATGTATGTATPSTTATGTATGTAAPSTTATATRTLTNTPGTTPVYTRTSTPGATTTPPTLASATPFPPTGTRVPTATGTAVPATSTPCALHFSDVQPTDYFYTPVQALACRGVIAGYSDGTFRPSNTTTRGQMVKLVVLGLGVPAYTPPTGATFADVPPAHPFFSVIEAAAQAGVVGGYTCGSRPDEPCDAQQRPYFRPGAAVTRGQLAKIVSIAAGWPAGTPAGATFADVPPDSPFFGFVEAASCRGIISGYTCGTAPGEPCDTGQRPYFRPGNSATRGQIAKIVYGVLQAPALCVGR